MPPAGHVTATWSTRHAGCGSPAASCANGRRQCSRAEGRSCPRAPPILDDWGEADQIRTYQLPPILTGTNHAGIVPSESAISLHVRHDERADRAVITAAPETNMAMVVLTRLHLLALEQIASRDVEPAGSRLHQLIAGDRKTIYVAAASRRIPGMRERRDGSDQHRNNK